MLSTITFGLILSVTLINSQYMSRHQHGLRPQARANSKPICLTGNCYWGCTTGTCEGIYYCGPNTLSCQMDCAKGMCNQEMAVISHSKNKATINCIDEATCGKMIVVCGDVDPNYIAELNNLPGKLQDYFQHLPRHMFQPGAATPGGMAMRPAPYGECQFNCGFKSCKDAHYVCQGVFKNGGGCEMNSRGRPSFENSYIHCGMKNPKSLCQANCGAANIKYINPLNFNNMGQDPPCHNSHYICFQGGCFCEGGGCNSIEFQRQGPIVYGNGKLKMGLLPAKKSVPAAKSAPAKKKKAAAKTAPVKRNTNAFLGFNWLGARKLPRKMAKSKSKSKSKKPSKPKRVFRLYTHRRNEPLKPDFLYGRFTHIRCGIKTCKIECERPNSCSALTIIAPHTVKKLTVECAEESCVYTKIQSLAGINNIKCVNHGACSGAEITFGMTKKEPKLGNRHMMPVITLAHVECQNGGCAKHHNPMYGILKVQGIKVTCNKEVETCEIYFDSQNSRHNYVSHHIPAAGTFGVGFNFGLPATIPPKPVNAAASVFATGSLDSGEFICNVRRYPVIPAASASTTTPVNAFSAFTAFNSPPSLSSNVPTCAIKCSTHIHNKYCVGLKYLCKVNAAQCQCEDFCTSHATECFQKRLPGDCPAMTFGKKNKKPAAIVKP